MGFRRPAEARGLHGQVPTPPDIADAMARWVLARPSPPRTLLEPGAGGFAFTRAVHALAPDVHATGVELDPDQPAYAGATQILGDFLQDGWNAQDRRFDAILCNPPYVRHHFLTVSYKQEVAARLGARAKITVSKLAGTHVYFLLRALELAAPGARLAFLTGAEWLEARYGASLRQLLVERGILRAVLTTRPEEAIFPGVLSTAAVLLLEMTPQPGIACAFQLDRAAFVAAIANGGAHLPRVATLGERWNGRAAATEASIALGTLFRVRRGIATGANAFFVLTDDAARAHHLPARHLRACLAGPRDLAPRWLLRPKGKNLPRAVRAYLAQGESAGLHERYLCRTRAPWYAVEDVAPAPLLVGYMTRGPLTVVRNHDAAQHLNLLHGIYPRAHGSTQLIDRLHAFLISPEGELATRAAARTYAGGLRKLEPRDLEAVRLPATFAGPVDSPSTPAVK